MKNDKFKRDPRKHLFVPEGFVEQNPASKALEESVKQASREMAIRIDKFLEMGMKLVLPEEVVKLVGENPAATSSTGSNLNQTLLDQLGIVMRKENHPHELGKMKVTLFIRARNYKESNFVIAVLEIISSGTQMQFTSKVNRTSAEHQYAFTHPAIRFFLRELAAKGNQEADRLYKEKAQTLKLTGEFVVLPAEIEAAEKMLAEEREGLSQEEKKGEHE